MANFSDLLSEAKVSPNLRRLIHKITATELTKLSEPCYYPSLKKYYFEFLHASGLTERNLKEHVKVFYKNTPQENWLLEQDPQAHFYIFLMYYFLTQKDQIAYSSAMTYFVIRYYSNLIRKHIKYCNTSVFSYTLENITKTHLFAREKTIPNSMYYLSKELQRKHQKEILESDSFKISKFIREARHRIAQSVRSFAEFYYKASEEGSRLKTKEEATGEEDAYQYQTLDKTMREVDKVVKNITVYKEVDRKAHEEALKICSINRSIAQLLVSKLKDTKYSDNVRTCLELFTKKLKTVEQICGKTYFSYVNSLMSIKRTSAKVYFKQQIIILLTMLLKDIEQYEYYTSLNESSKYQLKMFVAYYLTMTLRNSVCYQVGKK